ncbi:MAG TPA: hypothetical protein VFD13_05255, partial [Candidatus Kapabacteria bacterium]|nr:hypothetical protein [Candidatus Kapabacteria bacterium]
MIRPKGESRDEAISCIRSTDCFVAFGSLRSPNAPRNDGDNRLLSDIPFKQITTMKTKHLAFLLLSLSIAFQTAQGQGIIR